MGEGKAGDLYLEVEFRPIHFTESKAATLSRLAGDTLGDGTGRNSEGATLGGIVNSRYEGSTSGANCV